MVDLPPDFEALVRQRCRLLDDSEPLDPDAPLPALGVDSIEVVELIVDIEAVFRLEMPAALLVPEVFATAGTVWAAVRGLIPAAADQGVR